MKIGVIGVGVVGGAVMKGFEQRGLEVAGYDPYKEPYKDLNAILDAEVVFVCVPTYNKPNGEQDLLPMIETFQKLRDAEFKGVVCVKSTVLPGACRNLGQMHNLRYAHNPEFLTAAKPLEDFLGQDTVLISGPDHLPVEKAYQEAGFSKVLVYKDTEVTEMAKYIHNCFLATKVSFFNEMREICQMANIDFCAAREAAVEIGSIGGGHTQVPGPDGQIGFGGMCFPKDTRALLYYCLENQLHMELLKATVQGNLRRRPLE